LYVNFLQGSIGIFLTMKVSLGKHLSFFPKEREQKKKNTKQVTNTWTIILKLKLYIAKVRQ